MWGYFGAHGGTRVKNAVDYVDMVTEAAGGQQGNATAFTEEVVAASVGFPCGLVGEEKAAEATEIV